MKPIRAKFPLIILIAIVFLPDAFAAETTNHTESTTSAVTNAAPKKKNTSKTPSDDEVIKNFHSLGLINGQTNIFRCANPVMDVAEDVKNAKPTEAELKQAKENMLRLYARGVRTVISFQHQGPFKEGDTNVEHIAVTLEQAAAKEAGLAYVSYPMSNKGENSFKDMSDDAVVKMLDPISEDIFKFAKTGGVAFQCKSGKDRAGIMAGYLRLKYQHWTADEAIAEMRADGHKWTSFATEGETNSWHENHLRAIAKTLNPPAP